jgi:hypothetical protein
VFDQREQDWLASVEAAKTLAYDLDLPATRPNKVDPASRTGDTEVPTRGSTRRSTRRSTRVANEAGDIAMAIALSTNGRPSELMQCQYNEVYGQGCLLTHAAKAPSGDIQPCGLPRTCNSCYFITVLIALFAMGFLDVETCTKLASVAQYGRLFGVLFTRLAKIGTVLAQGGLANGCDANVCMLLLGFFVSADGPAADLRSSDPGVADETWDCICKFLLACHEATGIDVPNVQVLRSQTFLCDKESTFVLRPHLPGTARLHMDSAIRTCALRTNFFNAPSFLAIAIPQVNTTGRTAFSGLKDFLLPVVKNPMTGSRDFVAYTQHMVILRSSREQHYLLQVCDPHDSYVDDGKHTVSIGGQRKYTPALIVYRRKRISVAIWPPQCQPSLFSTQCSAFREGKGDIKQGLGSRDTPFSFRQTRLSFPDVGMLDSDVVIVGQPARITLSSLAVDLIGLVLSFVSVDDHIRSITITCRLLHQLQKLPASWPSTFDGACFRLAAECENSNTRGHWVTYAMERLQHVGVPVRAFDFPLGRVTPAITDWLVYSAGRTLRSLSLEYVTDDLLCAIGKHMKVLQRLYLDNAKGVTNLGLQSLRPLDTLRHLSITGVFHPPVQWLEYLPQGLSELRIPGMHRNWQHLPSTLTHLDCGCFPHSHSPPFNLQPVWAEIRAYTTSFTYTGGENLVATSLSHLTGLGSLKVLKLAANEHLDGSRFNTLPTSITHLDVGSCHLIRDADMSALSALPLHTLILTFVGIPTELNKVTGTGLAALFAGQAGSSLRHLALTVVTESGLKVWLPRAQSLLSLVSREANGVLYESIRNCLKDAMVRFEKIRQAPAVGAWSQQDNNITVGDMHKFYPGLPSITHTDISYDVYFLH